MAELLLEVLPRESVLCARVREVSEVRVPDTRLQASPSVLREALSLLLVRRDQWEASSIEKHCTPGIVRSVYDRPKKDGLLFPVVAEYVERETVLSTTRCSNKSVRMGSFELSALNRCGGAKY